MTRPTLTTLWITDGPGGPRIAKAASTSQQLPADPFAYQDGEGGLVRPLYDLDELAAMLETNSLHARCARQKATDVTGRGFALRARSADGEISPATAARWAAFVAEVEEDERGDESLKERIEQAAQDYESIGWGILEVSRRADGVIDGLWHVPAQTIRAHKDGRRFAQKRGGKTAWFRRFGTEGTVDREGGGWSERTVIDDWTGNELLVVRNYTPRSDFYGLPDHIPALSALAGWRAQAEFNVRFFDNSAVPAYAVVVEGADVSEAFETKILEHFRSIKGDPHRTIVIPVPGLPGDEATQVHVRFERLSAEIKDASFRLYKADNALEICIAHGVPPYRVGWPILGSLGGATAHEMTEIYNDSIVQPRQETWEQRLTRALLGRRGLDLPDVTLKAAELDTRNEARDVARATALWGMDALLPDEARTFFGLDPLPDERGQRTRSESSSAWARPGTGITDAGVAKAWTAEVRGLAALRERIESLAGLRAA